MAGLRVPLSTLRWRPCDRQRMTRGRDGWLGLSHVTLSFTTPRRSPGALFVLGAHLPRLGDLSEHPLLDRVEDLDFGVRPGMISIPLAVAVLVLDDLAGQ